MALIHTGPRDAATRRRRGSSMVELAIVLPLLFSVFFAIAEFSMLFLDYQAVTTAARDGARTATLFRPSCSLNVTGAVNKTVNDALTAAGLPATTPTLTGACVFPGTSTVTITVPYDFQMLPRFSENFGFGSINLTATSVMQNESTGS